MQPLLCFISGRNPLTGNFNTCKFKFVWRTYQKRVLDELQNHLEDDSLHIVAAPGSGKTVLGLETVIRLGRPALILSPTLTIRDQWADRFNDLFLKRPQEAENFVSKNMFSPKPLTSVTYQSLHSFVKENKDKNFSEKYFEILVLDEAHHLRISWWKSLVYFKEKMKKCRIIALTATPPYDVTFSEWERYTALCGPIDSEISVPELVKTGDLCFHRDYIFLSKPDQKNLKTLADYRRKIRELKEKIQRDEKFAKVVESHPWITDFENNMPESLGSPSSLASMLAFLEKHKSLCPSSNIDLRSAPKILTGGKGSLPEFDIYWLENLLNFAFFGDPSGHFLKSEEAGEIKKELERAGAVEKRKVLLVSNPKIKKMLVKNPGKLSSISEIARRESESLADKLRMVVLTDFICPSYLPKTESDLPELVKIGVVPIFETLRREGGALLKIGILCGKIVIVPKQAADALIRCLEEAGAEGAEKKIRPLKFDDRFVELKLDGRTKDHSVRAVTRIFTEGFLNILVGTKSLLGEGWDAPCINSLILASYVGSYMLSNQMRGRAIRIFQENPGKTANIWHLACVDPTAEDFGEDFTTLERRFLSFTGVALDKPVIRNGIKRMALDNYDISKEGLEEYNIFSLKKAMDRKSLEKDWNEALEGGSLLEEGLSLKKDSIKVTGLRTFILSETIKAFLFQGLGIGAFVFFNIVRNISFSGKAPLPCYFGIISAAMFFSLIFSSFYFLKALILYIKHGSLEKSLGQIGKCVLETLRDEDYLKTQFSKIKVQTKEEYGEVTVSLKGATLYEKTLFFNCLEEIFGAIRNPRYLLVRRSDFSGFLSFINQKFKRADYHNVPEILGKNRNSAGKFRRNWVKRAGKAFLVYTRNERGRMFLLKARDFAWSAGKIPRINRTNRWM